MARQTIKAQNEAGEARIKALAQEVINQQPRFAFGHGFLWVVAHFAGARARRFIAGYIDGRANHAAIREAVMADPAVQSAWINLD